MNIDIKNAIIESISIRSNCIDFNYKNAFYRINTEGNKLLSIEGDIQNILYSPLVLVNLSVDRGTSCTLTILKMYTEYYNISIEWIRLNSVKDSTITWSEMK